MDILKAATAPIRGIGWLIAKTREWLLQERAELEGAYEKEIQILRERLSRATHEADKAQIERDIREAEDRYIQHLRDKVVTMSKGVVRDRAAASIIVIDSLHLPAREGAALERAASTWAALEPPRTFEDRLILGNAFHMAGDFDRSLEEYDAALRLRQDDADALAGRGYVLVHLERGDEAVQAFERSLARRPNDRRALEGLGWALACLNRHEDALDARNRALALHPDDAVLLSRRAITLSKLKRHGDALADFNRALELEPHQPIALYNRACYLSLTQRYEEALPDLRQAIACDAKYQRMAREDEDFEGLRNDPQWGPKFWELVGTEDQA